MERHVSFVGKRFAAVNFRSALKVDGKTIGIFGNSAANGDFAPSVESTGEVTDE